MRNADRPPARPTGKGGEELMLGSLPTQTSAEEILRQIKQLAEGITYTAPELKAERRIEILTHINRIIREWEAS
jgi:hypothetical protein